METVSLSDRRLPLKFTDIRTRDECFFAGARDDDHTDAIVVAKFIESSNAFNMNL